MATTAHSLPLKIQIVSDLHLESRQGLPTIKRAAPVLALLGDIGYASCGIEGDKLKQFLHAQTEMFDEVIRLCPWCWALGSGRGGRLRGWAPCVERGGSP